MANRNVKLQSQGQGVPLIPLFDPVDKMQSNTLKRHPKMDLSKNDLLKLLSYLEGELQARDIVIAALRAEKAKQLLYQAKYGRFGLGDPFTALQRDSDNLKDSKFDEPAIKAMYDNQLSQLENLIATQRRGQVKMREQFTGIEKRYHKAVTELDDEKRKHAQDTAQGDDVTYMLEKERERLRQEVEFEKSASKKLEKDMKKTLASLEEEKSKSEKHKQIALLLIKERKLLDKPLPTSTVAGLSLSNGPVTEPNPSNTTNKDDVSMNLSTDSLKGLPPHVEAMLEEKLSEFDIEKQQLLNKLGREESRNLSLTSQVTSLSNELDNLRRQLMSMKLDAPSPDTRSVSPVRVVHPGNKPLPVPVQVDDMIVGGVMQTSPRLIRRTADTPVTVTDERGSPVGAPSIKPSLDVSEYDNTTSTTILSPMSASSKIIIPISGRLSDSVGGGVSGRLNESAVGGVGGRLSDSAVPCVPGTMVNNIAVSPPRRVFPMARGTPPPVPPNKPILPPTNTPRLPMKKPTPPPKNPSQTQLTSTNAKERFLNSISDGTNSNINAKSVPIPVNVITSNQSSTSRPLSHPTTNESAPKSTKTHDIDVVKACVPLSPRTLTTTQQQQQQQQTLQHPTGEGDTSGTSSSVNSPSNIPTTPHIPTPNPYTKPNLFVQNPIYRPQHKKIPENIHDSQPTIKVQDNSHVILSANNPNIVDGTHTTSPNIHRTYIPTSDHMLTAAIPMIDQPVSTQLASASQHVSTQQHTLTQHQYISTQPQHIPPQHISTQQQQQQHITQRQHVATPQGHTPSNVDEPDPYPIATSHSPPYIPTTTSTITPTHPHDTPPPLPMPNSTFLDKTSQSLQSPTFQMLSPTESSLSHTEVTSRTYIISIRIHDDTNQPFAGVYVISSVDITPQTHGDLNDLISEAITQYFAKLNTGLRTKKTRRFETPSELLESPSMGLTLNCVQHYTIGNHKWTRDTPPPPISEFLNTTVLEPTIMVHLHPKALVERLSLNTLVPAPLADNYIRLIEHYKNVVFHGTSKSFIVSHLVDTLVEKCRLLNVSLQAVKETCSGGWSSDDFKSLLLRHECLIPVSNHELYQNRGIILVLNEIDKLNIAQVFGELLWQIENRGTDNPFVLKGDETRYCFIEHFYLIATMDTNTSTSRPIELSTQQRFRWVNLRVDTEPLRGLVARHLLRLLIHAYDGCTPPSNTPLYKAIEWLVCVWHRLNDSLTKLGLTELTFGPAIFLGCPVIKDDAKAVLSWMCMVWNGFLAPAVAEAVARGSNDSQGQGHKVANTAVYVLMQRAVVYGCPLHGSEKEKYLKQFHGGNELHLSMKPGSTSSPSVRRSTPVDPLMKPPRTTSDNTIKSPKTPSYDGVTLSSNSSQNLSQTNIMSEYSPVDSKQNVFGIITPHVGSSPTETTQSTARFNTLNYDPSRKDQTPKQTGTVRPFVRGSTPVDSVLKQANISNSSAPQSGYRTSILKSPSNENIGGSSPVNPLLKLPHTSNQFVDANQANQILHETTTSNQHLSTSRTFSPILKSPRTTNQQISSSHTSRTFSPILQSSNTNNQYGSSTQTSRTFSPILQSSNTNNQYRPRNHPVAVNSILKSSPTTKPHNEGSSPNFKSSSVTNQQTATNPSISSDYSDIHGVNFPDKSIISIPYGASSAITHDTQVRSSNFSPPPHITTQSLTHTGTSPQTSTSHRVDTKFTPDHASVASPFTGSNHQSREAIYDRQVHSSSPYHTDIKSAYPIADPKMKSTTGTHSGTRIPRVTGLVTVDVDTSVRSAHADNPWILGSNTGESSAGVPMGMVDTTNLSHNRPFSPPAPGTPRTTETGNEYNNNKATINPNKSHHKSENDNVRQKIPKLDVRTILHPRKSPYKPQNLPIAFADNTSHTSNHSKPPSSIISPSKTTPTRDSKIDNSKIDNSKTSQVRVSGVNNPQLTTPATTTTNFPSKDSKPTPLSINTNFNHSTNPVFSPSLTTKSPKTLNTFANIPHFSLPLPKNRFVDMMEPAAIGDIPRTISAESKHYVIDMGSSSDISALNLTPKSEFSDTKTKTPLNRMISNESRHRRAKSDSSSTYFAITAYKNNNDSEGANTDFMSGYLEESSC